MSENKHLDEQILPLLYGVQAETEKPIQDIEPDPPLLFHQAVLNINGEMVPFTEEGLMDGKIRIPLPKTFHLMSPQVAAMKYPSERRPSIIYTNSSASINITFNETDYIVTEEGLEPFTIEMIQILRRTQPILQWFDHGIAETRGKQQIGYCEFLVRALNVNLYNLMFFTEMDDKALLCSFNCTEEEMKHWQPIARELMNALVIGEAEEVREGQ